MTTQESARQFADTAAAVGARIGLADETVAAAIANVESGLPLFAVSAWLAGGKDSVAEAVTQQSGLTFAHCSFARALKAEVNQMIAICAQARTPGNAVASVISELDCPERHAAVMVGLLWSATRYSSFLDDVTSADTLDEAIDRIYTRMPANVEPVGDTFVGDAAFIAGSLWPIAKAFGNNVDAYVRTVETRAANQYWGTEVRRCADPDYWIDRGLVSAIEAAAAGSAPYFTDARFLNEADGLVNAGFQLIRLDITRETQLARLAGRGDPIPDDSVLFHPSETGLDDYERFSLIVDNNGDFDTTVATINTHIMSVFPDAAAA